MDSTAKTLQDLLITMLEKVQSGVMQYAPEALKLVLFTMRLEAVIALVMSGVALLIDFGVMRWVMREVRRIQKDDPEITEGANGFTVAFCVVGCIYTLVSGIWFLITWVDIGVWFAVVDPRLALVRQILHKVLTVTK